MIRIEYATGRTRGEGKLSKALVQRIADAVAGELKLKEDVTISVALVDRKAISRVNATYRGMDAVTDVLSFTYEDPKAFGEILICPAYARECAGEDHKTLHAEMIDLLVHGLLHVFGYDHIRPKDAKVMFPLQEKLVQRFL